MKAIDKWVAEFFLRRQQNPRIFASTLFSFLDSVDSSDDSVKLKTTAVLRDISNSLIRGTISEGMLDLLEILEKLLLQEDSAITESLKSAYCWMAVECTVKFMWPENASDGLLGDAIERIWRKRIRVLKERESDLVSDELLKWESDLEEAFEKPEMYKKIRESNTRYIASSHLNRLLHEQWGLLVCSSLELETQKRLLQSRVGESTDRVMDESEGRNGKIREEVSDVDKVESVENPDGVGDKMIEDEEEHEPSRNKGEGIVARELNDYLLEIEGIVDPSTEQDQGGANSDIDHSADVTIQADHQAQRNETGGGDDNNEAEDSHGTSSASSSSVRVRPRLPTSEPLKVSPLKKKNSATSRSRRAMKFWTPEELEALKEGVKEYGKSWKDIKNSNPVAFADRTEVDLKDKWRNYMGR